MSMHFSCHDSKTFIYCLISPGLSLVPTSTYTYHFLTLLSAALHSLSLSHDSSACLPSSTFSPPTPLCVSPHHVIMTDTSLTVITGDQ